MALRSLHQSASTMVSRRASDLMGILALAPPCPYHGTRCLVQGSNTDRDYAVDIAVSNIRFGSGVTREVGLDAAAMGAKNVLVFTDPTISRLAPLRTTLDSLTAQKIGYQVFDEVTVEPTDVSFKKAISAAVALRPDLFIAVGGGSVIDTAKAANLYYSHPEADFLAFVNAPLGKGQYPTRQLKPLIAIPTTAGTGRQVAYFFTFLPTTTIE
jgi:hydroxyacid-oxoacid transhydrogenase